MHFQSNRMLKIFAHRDPLRVACSEDLWHALYLCLCNRGERVCCLICEDCSKYLLKVALKVISIGADLEMNSITVGMIVTEARSESLIIQDEADDLDALDFSTAVAN